MFTSNCILFIFVKLKSSLDLRHLSILLANDFIHNIPIETRRWKRTRKAASKVEAAFVKGQTIAKQLLQKTGSLTVGRARSLLQRFGFYDVEEQGQELVEKVTASLKDDASPLGSLVMVDRMPANTVATYRSRFNKVARIFKSYP